MDIRLEIRRWLGQSVVPAFCFMVVAYFTYHMVQGDRGLIALNRLEKEISLAEQALIKSEVERQRLQNKVTKLRPDSLDRDVLDERARDVLGLVRLDNLVIYYDSQDQADRAALIAGKTAVKKPALKVRKKRRRSRAKKTR
jgi:cell division protein FtsB